MTALQTAVTTSVGRGLASLRAFARPTTRERCEGCGTALAAAHDHVFVHTGQPLRCACVDCAATPSSWTPALPATARMVPRRVLTLDELALSDAAWASLGLPIALAFFVVRSRAPSNRAVVALYPSPAGLVESAVDDGLWAELVAATPALATLVPDVEALLVSRLGGQRRQLLVPVDAYFGLTGQLRSVWKGLFGGERAFTVIEEHLTALEVRAASQEGTCPR